MSLNGVLQQAARDNALMSVSEVALAMGSSTKWVRSLIGRGELRAINIGGPDPQGTRWRVDPEDLRAFLATRESRPRDLNRVDAC